jgi:hypothetical protein
MPSQPQPPTPPLDHEVLIDVHGGGEWIVGVSGSKQRLHVYRLGPSDWLVSEVGRSSEGRGGDLRQALAALSAGVPPPDWWKLIAEAVDTAEPL